MKILINDKNLDNIIFNLLEGNFAPFERIEIEKQIQSNDQYIKELEQFKKTYLPAEHISLYPDMSAQLKQKTWWQKTNSILVGGAAALLLIGYFVISSINSETVSDAIPQSVDLPQPTVKEEVKMADSVRNKVDAKPASIPLKPTIKIVPKEIRHSVKISQSVDDSVIIIPENGNSQTIELEKIAPVSEQIVFSDTLNKKNGSTKKTVASPNPATKKAKKTKKVTIKPNDAIDRNNPFD